MYAGDIIKQGGISKLVFDKRALTIFHQPTMEWYFTEWKEEMSQYGLNIHRKILPSDNFFNMAVSAAREKLDAKYPNNKYHSMDIQYRNTLEEAINS